MKKLFTKILILLMLFSIGAELSGVSFAAGSAQYAITNMDESDKNEKKEVEKDKILTLCVLNFLSFKKEIVSDFFVPCTSDAFKYLPEIPPKQA